MVDLKEIVAALNSVKQNAPLVHNITNYVVMNNTANALLSVGASPVMAHAVEEVEEMAGIASSLVINMGTLSEKWVDAMLLAGKKAHDRQIPIVFDPVGVGATSYRTETAKRIIAECHPTIIRGNASEIMALCKVDVQTKGVDSTESTDTALDFAKLLAYQSKAVVVISGETDYITDGKAVVAIENGNVMMTRVTGMGCTATAICGAFAGVEANGLVSASSAMAIMGICGEMAMEKANGPGSLQMHFIDALYNISAQDVVDRLKFRYE